MECQRSMVRFGQKWFKNWTLYVKLEKILLYKTGVKYELSTPKGRPMGCAGNSNWMMTRWTLPHPKPVPKTRTLKNGESLGRCNRPNTTSKGCLWLRCVLYGLVVIESMSNFAILFNKSLKRESQASNRKRLRGLDHSRN
jgi:hypothetical protein